MGNYRLYPNVRIGKGAVIGDHVIIGLAPRGRKEGELETVIGPHAVIRSHTVIYAGNTIGKDFQTGHHVMIREENTIADGVRVGTSSVIEHHVRIHKNVHIHSRAFIPEYSILHEGCWIGPAAVLTNTPHPLCPKAKECLRRGVIVKKYAKIGANATLLPHISIGEYCVVGSGAVVTKDIPAGKVVAGNPARIIKSLSQLKCHYDKNRRPYDEDPAC